jgi:Kef-type K+ transport system membrane component KefB
MQEIGQLLEMPLNFPSPLISTTAQLGRDGLRQVGDQDDLGLALAGRFVQPKDDPSQSIATSFGCWIIDPNRLFEDLASFATSHEPERLDWLERHGGRVPADQEERVCPGDAEQKGPNAKVAIRNPELAGLDEHLTEQRPFLRMSVLLKNQVEDQAANRLVDWQRHARQGPRKSRTQNGNAMVCPGQDVAVKDSRSITWDWLRRKIPSGGDQLAGSTGSFPHNGSRYAGFHSSQLAVESGKRSHQGKLTLLECRAGRTPKAARNITHNLNEMTEQELSGVLTLGNFVDDGLDGSAFYHPIQRDAGHDRRRRIFDETFKLGWDNNGTSSSERASPMRKLPILFDKRGQGNQICMFTGVSPAMVQSQEKSSAWSFGSSRARVATMYGAMVIGAIALFLLIDARGTRLVARAQVREGMTHSTPAEGTTNLFAHILGALAAVLVTGRLLGVLLHHVGQPPVIGEIVGGILLGPSLLGWLWPAATAVILPPSILPFLGVIAQLGVVLYMFLVGLELDIASLRKRTHSLVAISHASILAPFLLGAGLALVLYPRLSSREVPFTSFALFMGVASSITAFPVLARILTDRGMQTTTLGSVALGCAAVDDVTAWCLLAFVVAANRAALSFVIPLLALTAAYIAVMLLVVRQVAASFLERFDDRGLTPGVAAVAFTALLLFALTAELIGIHAIFGAFLFGAIITPHSRFARAFITKLEHLVTVLFLPAFFALAGMRTRIDLVSGVEQWLICGLIIFVATAGKFGGALVAARFTGMSWRDAAGLGVLMNTRGLMELIVLNIGLDLGVISPTLFTMMVLMALVTTIATTPVLHLLKPSSSSHHEVSSIASVARQGTHDPPPN